MRTAFGYAFLSCLLFSGCATTRVEPLEIGLAAVSKNGQLPPADELAAFESRLGRPLDTINLFQGFNGDTNELPPFPLESIGALPERVIPMLTWEPWGDLRAIAGGRLDDYIRQYARAMKAFGRPIRLRFGHEMIHDDNPLTTQPQWYPWQDAPEDFKRAWQKVHSIFKEEQATNVEFVWSVNFEPFALENVRKYYPDPRTVDWIGIDGYNWGGQDFDSVFRGMYRTVVEHPGIFGRKPVMLSEFAAAQQDPSKPFDKAAWVTDAFKTLKEKYPRVKSVYWFNVNKERDWRIDETPESWEAFKQAVGLEAD